MSSSDPAYEAFESTTVIAAPPERVWQALTDPELIPAYFDDSGPESDWQVGSAVLWRMEPGAEPRDAGQVVLAADPPRLLAYTWHTYEPEIVEMFGWDDARAEEARKEPLTQVVFRLAAVDGGTELSLVHEGFVPGSEMLAAVRTGWPEIIAGLKATAEAAP
ncbi:SRPBCC domain-containing protein [Yinghuangia soli]|uniref:SRPBCC domain-containing protein n=1 Tax=Yinghuangia soli TaxID=2908204 RepID=A0AA41Q6D0_9ACTN|nr:SRPBCC domain-containing protein [Yinghuangia soli]MCF2532091.1 SRPBCC domain-containing protein [Yinghuangia soli]